MADYEKQAKASARAETAFKRAEEAAEANKDAAEAITKRDENTARLKAQRLERDRGDAEVAAASPKPAPKRAPRKKAT
jgi:hypothetical protein